ncbi:sorting nexin-10B isoform X2 [Alosa sapidissima]|nr:sorting nexin-10B isoform X2 [Alosa sapidissima]
MKGLQQFLQTVVLNPLLLSDSCLHLFLQSQLSVPHMEACAEGRGGVTVTQAIHSSALSRLRFGPEQEEDLREDHQEQEEDLREDHQEQEEDLKEDHLVIGRSEREPAGVVASDVE